MSGAPTTNMLVGHHAFLKGYTFYTTPYILDFLSKMQDFLAGIIFLMENSLSRIPKTTDCWTCQLTIATTIRDFVRYLIHSQSKCVTMRSILRVFTALLLVQRSTGLFNRRLRNNVFDRFSGQTVEMGRKGKQNKGNAKKGKHFSISLAPSLAPSMTPTCVECDDSPYQSVNFEPRMETNNTLSGSFHFSRDKSTKSPAENSTETGDIGGIGQNNSMNQLANANASREVGLVLDQEHHSDSGARGSCRHILSFVLTFLAYTYS
jgi:hypothetical protein